MQTIKKQRIELDWLEEEFGHAALGDVRLTRRLMEIAQAFSLQPQGTIPRAMGGDKGSKGAYRFFDNEKLSLPKLLVEHREATLERMKPEAVVLAVQDTSPFNLSTHEQTEGLGPIGGYKDGAQGYLLHTTLALNGEGLALGVLDAQCWARSKKNFGQNHQRNARKVSDKESGKWLQGLAATQAVARKLGGTPVVMVGDREADFYDLFALAGPAAGGVELLVRSCYNRRLEVRFAKVTLRPAWLKEKFGPLQLWAILVKEPNAPKHAQPLCWRLLTSLEIRSFKVAVEKIGWYQKRWQIELYHQVLKTCCRLEQHQLQNLERLKRLMGVVLIARLGGFLARKSDGPPGVKTLAQGLLRLRDMVAGFRLARGQRCG